MADLNALTAFLGVHATYPNPYLPIPPGVPFFPTGLPGGYTPAQLQQLMNDPANRQTYGDTTYITIPANNLPLLQPLIDIGADTGLSALTTPIVDLIQPALRVLIELGYDRTIPYGQPTPAGLFPTIDPTKLATNLAAALGQGIQTALTDLATHATSPATSEAAQLAASATASTADNPAATTPNITQRHKTQPSSNTTSPAPLVSATAPPKTSLALSLGSQRWCPNGRCGHGERPGNTQQCGRLEAGEGAGVIDRHIDDRSIVTRGPRPGGTAQISDAEELPSRAGG